MTKYIDLAKAIKMLQKDRFYAILATAGALGVLWLLPPIITALRPLGWLAKHSQSG